MKVFMISGSNEKTGALIIDQAYDDSELLYTTPVKDHWKPVRCVNAEPKKEVGDFSGVMPYFLSVKGAKALEPFLKDSVELLPVLCDDGDYFLIHCIKSADVLDWEQSEIKYFSNSNKVMTINKYEFRKDIIKDYHLFKIDGITSCEIFVDEAFIEAVKTQQLTGFTFKAVWSDDPTENYKIKNPEPVYKYFKCMEKADGEEMEEIRRNCDFLIKKWGCEEDGKVWAEAIDQSLAEYLKTKEVPSFCEDEEEYIRTLGVLFGETLCKGYGWEWKLLGSNKKKMKLYVVSPKNYYCCDPVSIIQNIAEGKTLLHDGKSDHTIACIYRKCEKIADKPTSYYCLPINLLFYNWNAAEES